MTSDEAYTYDPYAKPYVRPTKQVLVSKIKSFYGRFVPVKPTASVDRQVESDGGLDAYLRLFSRLAIRSRISPKEALALATNRRLAERRMDELLQMQHAESVAISVYLYRHRVPTLSFKDYNQVYLLLSKYAAASVPIEAE